MCCEHGEDKNVCLHALYICTQKVQENAASGQNKGGQEGSQLSQPQKNADNEEVCYSTSHVLMYNVSEQHDI